MKNVQVGEAQDNINLRKYSTLINIKINNIIIIIKEIISIRVKKCLMNLNIQSVIMKRDSINRDFLLKMKEIINQNMKENINKMIIIIEEDGEKKKGKRKKGNIIIENTIITIITKNRIK